MSVKNKYAVEVMDSGAIEWFDYDEPGIRHRLEGPAVEHVDGSMEYWISGDELNEAAFKARTTSHEIIIDGVAIQISHDSYEALRTSLLEIPSELINLHKKYPGYSGLYLGVDIRATANTAWKNASVDNKYAGRTYVTIDRDKNELHVSATAPTTGKIAECFGPNVDHVERYIMGTEPFSLSGAYLKAVGFSDRAMLEVGHTADGTIVIRKPKK